jgi:hypothetical protein
MIFLATWPRQAKGLSKKVAVRLTILLFLRIIESIVFGFYIDGDRLQLMWAKYLWDGEV